MTETVKEAVGIFESAENLEKAVDGLQVAGFDRAQLSLLATDEALRGAFGERYTATRDLEDETGVPYAAYPEEDSKVEAKATAVSALAYVGAVASAAAVVASGGAVGAALGAAVAAGGAGGAVGAYLSRFIEERYAHVLEEQLAHGGLLLWVQTPDDEAETKARDILTESGAKDVHVHDIPVESHPAEGGVSRELSFIKHLGL
ncbi:MAG: hypothetical protein R3316_12320 [Rhodovibrionaceae bacterium]|nr:hypothetical protein [Rhodovibrionaceae bacterium]